MKRKDRNDVSLKINPGAWACPNTDCSRIDFLEPNTTCALCGECAKEFTIWTVENLKNEKLRIKGLREKTLFRLDGKTPAEASKIASLGQLRWENLIRKSARRQS